MRIETRYFQHEAEVPEPGLTYRINDRPYVVPILGEAWGHAQDEFTRLAVRRLGPDAFQAIEYNGGPAHGWVLTEILAWPALQFCPLRIQGPQRRQFEVSVNVIGVAHQRLSEIVARSTFGERIACVSSRQSRHSKLGLDVPATKRALLQTLAELQPMLEGLNRLALANRELQRRLVVFAAETIPTLLNQEANVVQ